VFCIERKVVTHSKKGETVLLITGKKRERKGERKERGDEIGRKGKGRLPLLFVRAG